MKKNGNAYSIKCNSDLVLGKLSSYAEKQGAVITNVSVRRPNLEDVFFKYTGETLSDEDVSDSKKKDNRKEKTK